MQQNEEEKAKDSDIEFKDIKNELEKSKENVINLIDDETMAQKIRESNLYNNQKNELQLLHVTRLRQLQRELYENNENKIGIAKYLSKEQKNDLHCLRNDRKWNLKRETTFEKFKKDIENEEFIGNLLDRKLYNTLIKNNTLLNKEQKTQLHKQRAKQISNRLEDKGYYDSRISEIKKNFLTNRKVFDLHILRRHQLDKLQAKTKDEIFDTLSQLLNLTEDLEELTDEVQITSNIKKLNQTLLTNECYID
ncbi:44005_t:CDS:2 [Gigaspora margarita]|uniref:44005_t:CDS:1 n=1 Tax=Gigaspora margarita TaxID=4874 RepID=A0ABN7V5M8_GIGMA|nr:44005_t:CDS:2 [Gigaspora margarita]